MLASSWRCSPTTSTSPASQVFSYRYWRYSCGPSYSAQPSAASWAFTSRASISPDPTPRRRQSSSRAQPVYLRFRGRYPCRPTSESSSSAATVRAGEEELFKHRAREKGRIKILAWFDSYRLSSKAVWKPRCPSTNQTPALNRLPDRSAPLTRPRTRGLRQHLRGPRSIALSQTPV